MADFMIRFLICNLFICALVEILLTVRYLLRNILSGRMQYHLWFLLLGLLTIPFLPLRLTGFPMLLARPFAFCNPALLDIGSVVNQESVTVPAGASGWLNDFTLSISNQAPSIAGTILLGIWLAGILVMVVLTARSSLRLQNIRQSALPLQNPEIRRLYCHCLKELHIRKEIPIYSTAFLQSPVFTGFLRPRIYLPIHIISDSSKTDTGAVSTERLGIQVHPEWIDFIRSDTCCCTNCSITAVPSCFSLCRRIKREYVTDEAAYPQYRRLRDAHRKETAYRHDGISDDDSSPHKHGSLAVCKRSRR